MTAIPLEKETEPPVMRYQFLVKTFLLKIIPDFFLFTKNQEDIIFVGITHR